MPQRKIIGPDSSFSYKTLIKNESEDVPQIQNEPRKIYMKMGVLSQVKGSAYMETGKTKIIAATFSPKELSKLPRKSCLGSIHCEVKYAPFAIENEDLVKISKKERHYSMALKKALLPVVRRNEFTNFQIDIFVYVLEDNGCVLSSAINCAGAALIDGGIPMFDIITATTIGVRKDQIFIDPSRVEEEYCTASEHQDDVYGLIVISRLEVHDQIPDCFQIGFFTLDTLQKVNEAALERNKHLLKTIKQILVRKVKLNVNC